MVWCGGVGIPAQMSGASYALSSISFPSPPSPPSSLPRAAAAAAAVAGIYPHLGVRPRGATGVRVLPPMVSTSFVAAEAAAMDAVQRRLMFEDEYVAFFIFSLRHGRLCCL